MELIEVKNVYYQAVHDSNREQAKKIIRKNIGSFDPEELIFKVIVPSIDKMLEAFLEDQVILTQHFIGTKISEELIDELLPQFKQQPNININMVIGCAKGDFHGLGKKIVKGVLKAHMINVIDLGLNVAPEKFIEAADEHNAAIIGISSMMVHTAIGDEGPKKVRELLKDNNLEQKYRLIVGGAPYQFDQELYTQVGADSWASNALEAVQKIKELEKSFNHVI